MVSPSSLTKFSHLLRHVPAVLTDLGYLLGALSPHLRRLARGWARPRYGRLAGRYDRHVQTDSSYFAPLLRILDRLPDANVIVDVGAGTGAATRRLQQRYPRAKIVAIDLSPPMLSRLPTGITAVIGDASALPVLSGSADLVVVHNAPFAPNELYRVVRVGGTIAIVLSAARAIPPLLARLAFQRAAPGPVAQVEEHRAGAGVAWIIRR
jgi:SAM-dependent methyltransferase